MLASRRIAAVCFALVSLLGLPAHAGPLGAPFKVNIYDLGNQFPADLTAGTNGDVIVTWIDQARGSATFMQRYDWQGVALQPDDGFLGTNYHQAAVSNIGRYVVLRTAPDGSGNGVYATVYDRQGLLVVPEFRVNDITAGNQINPVVAMNTAGELAFAWTHQGAAPVVYAKRYDANGVALGPQTPVGSSGAGQQETQSIAIDAAGNFVVVWFHFAPPGSPPDIWARRFSSAGAPLGSTWRVNMYTVSTQDHGRVAMNAQGDFIVVWNSWGQVPNSMDVFGQRYIANGSPVGGEFRVNDATAGDQYYPEVGLLDDGSFVVAWTEFGITPSPRVMARQFWPNGTAVATEAEVNTPGILASSSRLTLDPAGRFTVAWLQSNAGTGYDIYARRYAMDTLPSVTTLADAVAVNNISAATGDWNHYKIVVPPGNTTLFVDMSGAGTPGEANVYVRYAAMPTLTTWLVRPMTAGNTEQFQINNVAAGEWYISIHAQAGYSGVSLTADYSP